MARPLRVAVVGTGILGAAAAFHLAQPGLAVHLFEAQCSPAGGVTRDSFGWLNLIRGDPAATEAYDLRAAAFAEYEALLRAAPELVSHIRRGSLVWEATPEATRQLAARHTRSYPIHLLPAAEVASLEPALRCPPPLAMYAPHDLALDVPAFVRSLLARAVCGGAVPHFGTPVTGLEYTGGTVTGLRFGSERVPFDTVVLAAGPHTTALVHPLGLDLGMRTEAAVLLRFGTRQPFLRHVVSCPALEIRQDPAGTLLVAEHFEPGCEAGNFHSLRQRVIASLREMLSVPADLAEGQAAVGHRPMFADGLPVCGFVSGVAGLYVLAGHPGVLLAPLLGRRAAEEIIAYH